MYSNPKTLAQEVKREVMSELQQRNYANIPQFGGQSGSRPYGTFEQWGDRPPDATGRTFQTVKDSVKNEVLAEIQRQQADKLAQTYGLDRSLSDRRLQQMIDSRFRAIDNLKANLKKELQEMEAQQSRDPFIRQTAQALAEEARRQGIPQEQLLRSLEQKNTGNAGLMSRLSQVINTGQRRGFLCGIGLMLLCHLIMPSTRKSMHTVAVRSMEEGLAMMERAKSFVHGQQQQTPPADLNSVTPETPQPPQSTPPPQPAPSPPDGNPTPGE